MNLKIAFVNPYNIFNQEAYRNVWNDTELHTWCQNLYYENFIMPITKMCPALPKYPTAHEWNFQQKSEFTRQKRAIFAAVVIYAFVIFTVGGIVGSAIYQSKSANDLSTEIEKLQNDLIKRFEEQDKVNELLIQAIENLKKATQRTSVDLRNLQKVLPSTITTVSALAAKLISFGTELNVVNYEWKDNKVDHRLMKLFNFTPKLHSFKFHTSKN